MTGPGVALHRGLRRAGLVMVGGLVVLTGCGGDDDPEGYGPELRSDFVEDCTRSDTPEDVCRCYYESLASEVPFSRYEEIETRLQEGGEIPTDVADLAAACAAEPEPEPAVAG